MTKFTSDKSYKIETLPNDLYWATKKIMLWSDCQGWWIEEARDYFHWSDNHGHDAYYWRPLPDCPMTRDEILKMRGNMTLETFNESSFQDIY